MAGGARRAGGARAAAPHGPGLLMQGGGVALLWRITRNGKVCFTPPSDGEAQ